MKTRAYMGSLPSLALILALLLGSQLGLRAAATIFLSLPPISGESENVTHKAEMEVLSFQFGLSNAVVSTGEGTGKPFLSDITITKFLDRASPTLAQTLTQGTHLKTAKLSVQRVGTEKPIDYYTIDLEDVMITSVSVAGDAGDSRPTEVISLNFNKATWTYKVVGTDGALKETVTGSFNKKTGAIQ